MARASYRYGRRQRRSPFALLRFPLFLLGTLGACAFAYWLIALPPEQRAAAAATATPVTLGEQDVIRGDPGAPVRFFLYCDIAAPECARFNKDILPKLEEQYIATSKVAVVFRATPQRRNLASRAAANASLCANAQGKFWEWFDLLVSNQAQWRNLSPQAQGDNLSKANQKFMEYAQELGLDTAAFETCIKNQEFEEKVTADIELAKSASANTVYAFRISQSQTFQGFRDYNFVKTVVDAELP